MPRRARAARRTAAVPLGAAAALVGAAPLRAQPAGTRIDAEVGAAVIRQPGAPAFSAPTLGGAWAWDGARTAVRAEGVAAAGTDAWSGQLAAAVARFVGDPDSPLELGARARVARAPASRATAQLLADARRHFTFGPLRRPSRGVWVGGLGGFTTVAGAAAAPLVGVDAGAWRAVGGGTRLAATAAWSATRADFAALATAGAPPNSDPPDPAFFAPGTSQVRTLDFIAAAERVGARVELAGSFGARHTALSPALDGGAGRGWGALVLGAVTCWVRPGVGLVAGAGSQPADPARGLPAVRHVALSVRLRPLAWRGAAAFPLRQAHGAGAPHPTADVTARPSIAADGSRVLHVAAPGATRVRIRAAATAWHPVDLVRSPDGDWVITLPWPAGAHRVALQLDDGAWRAPANLPRVDDEFGGEVGLLVVP